MRKTSRSMAALCLLALAACGHNAAVAPPAQPQAVEFPDGMLGDLEPGRSPMFKVVVPKTAEGAEDRPLYIMDGGMVPGTPYLRPVDIHSVEVVRGEAAVSRYGTTRDVVVVTTRWGHARSSRP